MASRSLPEAKPILEIISLQGLHRLSDPSRGAGYLANLKSRKTISQVSSPSSLLFEDGALYFKTMMQNVMSYNHLSTESI
jgi:hypothetical protein